MLHNYSRELGIPRKTSIRGCRAKSPAVMQAFKDIADDLRQEYGNAHLKGCHGFYIRDHGSLIRTEKAIRSLTEDLRATQP